MEEKQGTTIYDSERDDGGQDGTLTGGATFIGQDGVAAGTGKYGSALQVAEATTNLITNPSLETGTTNWSTTNGTLSQVNSGSSSLTKIGSYYAQFTPGSTAYAQAVMGLSLTAGLTYTASAYVDPGTNTTVVLEFKDTNGTWTGDTVSVTTPGRYSVTRTMRADATGFQIAVRSSGSAGTYYFDAVQVEQKTYATPYCDGTLGNGHSWSGTAHASTSSRTTAGATVSNSVLNPSSGSISLWFNTLSNRVDAGYNNWLFSTDNDRDYEVEIPRYNSKIGAYIDGTFYDGLGSETVSYSQWNHLVMVWNGTNTQFHLNGKYLATVNANPGIPTSNLRIGGLLGSDSYILNGSIDDFRVYNYTLTTEQIKQLYNENSSVRFAD